MQLEEVPRNDDIDAALSSRVAHLPLEMFFLGEQPPPDAVSHAV